MPTNIKQLAEFAKVSPATVSKALSGRTGVRAGTRERIVSLANKLNYQPSGLGRSLVRGNTEYIGLDYQRGSLPTGTTQIMLQSIEDRLRKRGYSMMIVTRLSQGDVEVPRIMRDRMVDGVIVAHSHDRVVEKFAHNVGLAHVALNVSATVDCDCVSTDSVHGTRLAVQHLFEMGHRRIAFVNSMFEGVHSSQANRVAGYTRAISESGLVVIPGAEDVMPVEQNVNRYLSREAPPTAFVCFNDLIAVQAIHYLKKHGLRVPHDASVIGCDDDSELVRYIDPPLTTLQLPLHEMGGAAADLVLDRLDDPHGDRRSLVFPQKLVVRGSTAPPKP